MDDVDRLMWKGGREPTSFPHVCPYRLGGADKQVCIELSGGNLPQNVSGCCGTSRGTINFAPCNSVARRCVVCLHVGRRGVAANAVTNVSTGTCDEHAEGVPSLTIRTPKKRIQANPKVIRQEKSVTLSVFKKEESAALQSQVPREITYAVEVPLPNAIPQEPLVVFEKKRRKSAVKLAALNEAAGEIRKEKVKLQSEDIEPKLVEQDIQIGAHELIAHAAKHLGMSRSGLRTYYYRSIPIDMRKRWLYGKLGHKRSRSEIKFEILMQVRDEFRKKGEATPRKKELAEAAAGPLGMTLNSTRTYIYDRLTSNEVKRLELRGQFLSLPEQVEVLKKIREEMREKGLPPPRHVDLAKAAAPLLKQKVNSVRTLIGGIPDETKEELGLLGSRSGMFASLDPLLIRNGFIGAVAVLKFRKAPLTADNLRLVLRLKLAVVESYLAENPDVAELLQKDDEL